MSTTENNTTDVPPSTGGLKALLQRVGLWHDILENGSSVSCVGPDWWREASVHSTHRNEDETITVNVTRVNSFFSRCQP